MNRDAAQWVGHRYALAGRPLSACPFDANGAPAQRVFAARFVQGYLDAAPDGITRSANLDEEDLIRSEDDKDELDDEFDEEVEAAVEAVEWPDDDDEADRSESFDEDDDIIRAFDREQLHHYWTRSAEGLAKWAATMHGAWTRLYRHLRKHVGSERAKRMAAQWHKEVFGIWPGEKAGSNPVGPG